MRYGLRITMLGKNGPFMNPIMFREYELPYLKAIVNIGKRYGIPVSEAF